MRRSTGQASHAPNGPRPPIAISAARHRDRDRRCSVGSADSGHRDLNDLMAGRLCCRLSFRPLFTLSCQPYWDHAASKCTEYIKLRSQGCRGLSLSSAMARCTNYRNRKVKCTTLSPCSLFVLFVLGRHSLPTALLCGACTIHVWRTHEKYEPEVQRI